MYANHAKLLEDGESQVSNRWMRQRDKQEDQDALQVEIGLVNEETNKQRLASVRKKGRRDGDDEGKNWNYEGEEGGKK